MHRMDRVESACDQPITENNAETKKKLLFFR